MEKKKEKSPILVVMTIMFLLVFIVLPPLFRSLFPKKVEEIEEKPTERSVNYILVCEKILSSENVKVISEVVYKNDSAITNTITYTDYATESVQNETNTETDAVVKTTAEEIAYFKTIPGVQVTEDVGKTVVVIPKMVVNNNPEDLDLANYLLDVSKQSSYFEKKDFTCKKNDN